MRGFFPCVKMVVYSSPDLRCWDWDISVCFLAMCPASRFWWAVYRGAGGVLSIHLVYLLRDRDFLCIAPVYPADGTEACPAETGVYSGLFFGGAVCALSLTA